MRISSHSPHSRYAIELFPAPLPSLRRPPTQRAVFGGDVNVDSHRKEEGFHNTSERERLWSAPALFRRDFNNRRW